MSAADRLTEIQARADNATDGPWEAIAEGDHESRVVAAGDDMALCLDCHTQAGVEPSDAEFISHARTDVPRLVAALQAVLAQCDRHESIGSFTDYEVGRKYVAGCVRRAVENALGVAS